jgi:putative addiction module component (TIGR02574 family)
MNERVRKLTEEIRKLSPEERIELLDEVMEGLDGDLDAGLDQAFHAEIQRRIASYDRGEVATRDAREVLRKFQKQ